MDKLVLGAADERDDYYYYEIVRKNMRRLREERGMTQEKLAAEAGLSLSYVSNLENLSKRRRVRISTLGRIAEALGVEIGEMFED